jgi:hypothetical protein
VSHHDADLKTYGVKRVPRLIEEYWRGARLTAGTATTELVLPRLWEGGDGGDYRSSLWSRTQPASPLARSTVAALSVVSAVIACNPSQTKDMQSPPSARATRSTPSPTQPMVPGAVLDAAKRYSSLVNRYNALI